MKRILIPMGVVVVLMLNYTTLLFAQKDKSPSGMRMPPAKVVVAEVSRGMIAPESEFIGTVYYVEVSRVASEVNGRVDALFFEAGQRVKQGTELVRLNAELLEKTLQSQQAAYEEVYTQLEKARIDFRRVKKLFQKKTIQEQAYDDARYKVKTLEKHLASLKAEVERIQTELKKKHIKAPFDGVVIEKKTEIGEWVMPGTTVAVIARIDVVDVIADVPATILPFIHPGMEVEVSVAGRSMNGKVFTIIPRGNIETRTFPVKIRLEGNEDLIEGMEAHIKLPTGPKQECLIVPRDALITQFGQTVVFSVQNGIAKMHPVKVVGYEQMKAGIQAMNLSAGMKVVIKGNERLRDGQPVAVINH
ncbi:efflux RND transporter periplasmic adaptor subunit [Candidatus Sumerlaeota bacterium]|nr:efflux RND transporter periplasmic adaptor subunit [Candidatus Sumerlaeota bacterium]